MLFDSCQNANDYQYAGAELGDVADMYNNANMGKPDINVLQMVAELIVKAPLEIIKGIAETVDPEIIVVKNYMDDNDIPPSKLSAMVWNEFMPINIIIPPFNPSPGPPITPLGLAYLGLDYLSNRDIPKEEALTQTTTETDAGPVCEGFKDPVTGEMDQSGLPK